MVARRTKVVGARRKAREAKSARLYRIPALLGVVLVDHIVFGRRMCWMSLREWAESGGVLHAAPRGMRARR